MIKSMTGDDNVLVVSIIMMLSYVSLLFYVSRMPDLPTGDIIEIPEVGKTVKAGLHFLLPVILLIWLLTVERFFTRVFSILGNSIYGVYRFNTKNYSRNFSWQFRFC